MCSLQRCSQCRVYETIPIKAPLKNKALQHAEKDVAFFQRHEAGLKRQRLDCIEIFNQSNVSVIKASYVIALEIAKQKKSLSIGETLVKLCLLKTAKLVLGDAMQRSLNRFLFQIVLSRGEFWTYQKLLRNSW